MARRRAARLPRFSEATRARMMASASPSNREWRKTVRALREPVGRPLGLPDWPETNWPRFVLVATLAD